MARFCSKTTCRWRGRAPEISMATVTRIWSPSALKVCAGSKARHRQRSVPERGPGCRRRVAISTPTAWRTSFSSMPKDSCGLWVRESTSPSTWGHRRAGPHHWPTSMATVPSRSSCSPVNSCTRSPAAGYEPPAFPCQRQCTTRPSRFSASRWRETSMATVRKRFSPRPASAFTASTSMAICFLGFRC